MTGINNRKKLYTVYAYAILAFIVLGELSLRAIKYIVMCG